MCSFQYKIFAIFYCFSDVIDDREDDENDIEVEQAEERRPYAFMDELNNRCNLVCYHSNSEDPAPDHNDTSLLIYRLQGYELNDPRAAVDALRQRSIPESDRDDELQGNYAYAITVPNYILRECEGKPPSYASNVRSHQSRRSHLYGGRNDDSPITSTNSSTISSTNHSANPSADSSANVSSNPSSDLSAQAFQGRGEDEQTYAVGIRLQNICKLYTSSRTRQ